jgi:hypothetical protein
MSFNWRSMVVDYSWMNKQAALCCGQEIDPLHDHNVEPVTELRASERIDDDSNSQYDRVVIGFRHRDRHQCSPRRP